MLCVLPALLSPSLGGVGEVFDGLVYTRPQTRTRRSVKNNCRCQALQPATLRMPFRYHHRHDANRQHSPHYTVYHSCLLHFCHIRIVCCCFSKNLQRASPTLFIFQTSSACLSFGGRLHRSSFKPLHWRGWGGPATSLVSLAGVISLSSSPLLHDAAHTIVSSSLPLYHHFRAMHAVLSGNCIRTRFLSRASTRAPL